MRYFEKALVYVVNLALGLLASVGFIYVLGSALGGIVISDMPERLRPTPLPWFRASEAGENLFSLLMFGGPVVILELLILFNWATRYVPANFGFRLVAFVIGVVIPGINLH
ncbi:hypothetical protein [Weissella confusa]|uniref:Uncharacterized protein n=1 Tax=Weissella confusa TaxID=1583 RepID=A0A4Z0RW42_WEICO|nr:hypothetical protein [Weissella confusa]TGE73008.1 hypothetical protein C6P11_05200 [Weissella confusa]